LTAHGIKLDSIRDIKQDGRQKNRALIKKRLDYFWNIVKMAEIYSEKKLKDQALEIFRYDAPTPAWRRPIWAHMRQAGYLPLGKHQPRYHCRGFLLPVFAQGGCWAKTPLALRPDHCHPRHRVGDFFWLLITFNQYHQSATADKTKEKR